MQALHLNGQSYRVPSTLSEMRPNQLAAILEILARCSNALAARWLVLFELLEVRKLRNWRIQLFLRFHNPSPEESAELLRLTDWLFDQPATLNKQLMPAITVRYGWFGIITLHGPTDVLGHSTFREFVRAMRFYADYLVSEDTDHLDLFVACLYRPAGGNPNPNDLRAFFDDGTYTRHLYAVQAMSFGQKLLVAKLFEGTLTYCQRAYPLVFPKPTETKAKTKPMSGLDLQDMWISINFQLAADPTKDEATFDQPMHNILKRLQIQIEANNRLKETAK